MNKENEEEKISDKQLYAWILDSKHHEEKQRDEINKYYISLFTSILAVAPLIERFLSSNNLENINLLSALSVLSFIGLSISISWLRSLKRMYNYIEAYEYLLIKIEEKHHKEFIRYVSRRLSNINSPDHITKHLMYMPLTFSLVFAAILFYRIGKIILILL